MTLNRRVAATLAAMAAVAVVGVAVPAAAYGATPTVSCKKSIGNTGGWIQCTSKGGTYTFKDVYADCAGEFDPHHGKWSINGTSRQYFECTYDIRDIHAVK